MPRGRKPLPTNWHVLNGNPSKKDLDTKEPRPAPTMPSCPAWLKPEAKRLWNKLARQLNTLGVLTSVDGEAFAAACQNWAIWVECEKFFKARDLVASARASEIFGKAIRVSYGRTYAYTNKAGATNLLPRPEVAIGQRALADAKAFFGEFGLTPASRTRIHLAPPEGEEDPMERLLGKAGG